MVSSVSPIPINALNFFEAELFSFWYISKLSNEYLEFKIATAIIISIILEVPSYINVVLMN